MCCSYFSEKFMSYMVEMSCLTMKLRVHFGVMFGWLCTPASPLQFLCLFWHHFPSTWLFWAYGALFYLFHLPFFSTVLCSTLLHLEFLMGLLHLSSLALVSLSCSVLSPYWNMFSSVNNVFSSDWNWNIWTLIEIF